MNVKLLPWLLVMIGCVAVLIWAVFNPSTLA